MQGSKAVDAEGVGLPSERAGYSSLPPVPRIWLLLGERYGDNAQVLALGKTLSQDFGWPSEIKQIFYDANCDVSFRERGASLVGVDKNRTKPLTPPWPDIVIAIGKSSASVVRWIKEQTCDHAISVQLGRPRTAYHHFDLLVTTPQFSMPPGDNVIRLSMPITLHDEKKLAAEAELWQQHFAHLPKPWTAVLVGGDTAQLSFDQDDAQNLVDQMSDYQRQVGGSLLVTTSPRTPADVADILQGKMPNPHFFFRWAKDVPNPYYGFLALADNFIVTNDSVTMIAEAADRAKPTYIYTLPRRELGSTTWLNTVGRWLRLRRERRKNIGSRRDMIDRLFDSMTHNGVLRPRNNVDWFEATLYGQGIARPLGRETFRSWTTERVTEIERRIVTDRIRVLWERRVLSSSAVAS
ncbi:mitochondrial fission ELM1 family protein [Dongia soli]|uniref:Mitochondrial fission ELM1 family protein n=1 Tax=Dongia soli TaxID=600628 RepID=A0ABU5ECH4_9PROT|nr:mitochondrial fission ELM1 family protein [Dongia soli]MDY0883128.1 mitochondrial fission ELM1 family protein [Dongia soli]